MKIDHIDLQVLKQLRVELDKDLAKLGEKYGLLMKTGSAAYTHTSVNFKLNCTVAEGAKAGSDPMVVQAQIDWKFSAKRFGFKTVWLNKKFDDRRNRGELKVIGLMPNRRKYPVLVQMPDGSKKLFPVGTVAAGFAPLV